MFRFIKTSQTSTGISQFSGLSNSIKNAAIEIIDISAAFMPNAKNPDN